MQSFDIPDYSDAQQTELSDTPAAASNDGIGDDELDAYNHATTPQTDLAKEVVQFFLSSIEGDFSIPVATFPAARKYCMVC